MGTLLLLRPMKNARFLSAGLGCGPAYAEASSTAKKSLNCGQAYSGRSELKKLARSENELALDGTRTCSVNITGSCAVVLDGCGQPGAFGSLPPLAASRSAGAADDVPVAVPVWR